MRNERAARYSDLFAVRRKESSDCDYCPWCSTIAVVRKTKPEVLEHLSAAAREMIVAASLLLQEAEGMVSGREHRHAAEEEASPNVTRIDGGSIS